MQNLVSLTNESPQDIQKALRYYERAAISPDYLDFNDHAYVTMQAIILRTLNIDGQSQDWSRIAHLLQQPAIYTRCDLAVSRLCIYFQKVIPPP